MSEKLKRCSTCKIYLDRSEFTKYHTPPDGLSYNCRGCSRKWGRNAYYRDHDKTKERKRKNGLLCYKKMKKLHPEKEKAQHALRYSVNSGKIKRLSCEVCRDKKSHGHHPDYSKPLEVIWLCQLHHAQEHRKLNKSLAGDG